MVGINTHPRRPHPHRVPRTAPAKLAIHRLRHAPQRGTNYLLALRPSKHHDANRGLAVPLPALVSAPAVHAAGREGGECECEWDGVEYRAGRLDSCVYLRNAYCDGAPDDDSDDDAAAVGFA